MAKRMYCEDTGGERSDSKRCKWSHGASNITCTSPLFSHSQVAFPLLAPAPTFGCWPPHMVAFNPCWPPYMLGFGSPWPPFMMMAVQMQMPAHAIANDIQSPYGFGPCASTSLNGSTFNPGPELGMQVDQLNLGATSVVGALPDPTKHSNDQSSGNISGLFVGDVSLVDSTSNGSIFTGPEPSSNQGMKLISPLLNHC
jgi:hypothetical protein